MNEFYVLVARTISHPFAALTREILFLPFEHKIHKREKIKTRTLAGRSACSVLRVPGVQFQASFHSTHESTGRYVARALRTMSRSVGSIKQYISLIIAVFLIDTGKVSLT